MTVQPVRLVLGSGSPRRLELLGRLGLVVEVIAPGVDETQLPGESPPLHALRVARLKARWVSERFHDRPVLAADTVVALGEAVYGKPRNRAEAASMLAELAGRTHTVLTALVLHFMGREACHLEAAAVTMVPFRRELVEWYVATGEGDDKAGAYAVQGGGAILVERVEGNVEAVMGLPLAPLPALCAEVGLCLAREGDRLALSRRDGTPLRAPKA
ncbi:MAG: Maf family nucleotide pyrophosphatase [Thermoanaerobaculaceae bacterium]|jgi:septum formation protein